MLCFPYKLSIYYWLHFFMTSEFRFLPTWSLWFCLWFSLPFLIAFYLCRGELAGYFFLGCIHVADVVSPFSDFVVEFHFYLWVFSYFGWWITTVFTFFALLALFSWFFLFHCFIYMEAFGNGLFFVFLFFCVVWLVNYFSLGDVHHLILTFSISFCTLIISRFILLKIDRTRSHFSFPLFDFSNRLITRLFPVELFVCLFSIIL